jgi:hypothetical protein
LEAPNPETVRLSAVSFLRESGDEAEAALLSRSKLELSRSVQKYINTTAVGLQFTLHCTARDLPLLKDREFGVPLPSSMHTRIEEAISAVLPGEFMVHDLAARSVLVDRDEFEKSELERLIDAQKSLMIAVATVGFLCRECLFSLAEAVYDPNRHTASDGVTPSKTDAARMLEAYFGAEYSGSSNEVLRRHAKASLALAAELQHKRTANYRDAALCAEATRTVVNIVAITSGWR